MCRIFRWGCPVNKGTHLSVRLLFVRYNSCKMLLVSSESVAGGRVSSLFADAFRNLRLQRQNATKSCWGARALVQKPQKPSILETGSGSRSLKTGPGFSRHVGTYLCVLNTERQKSIFVEAQRREEVTNFTADGEWKRVIKQIFCL